MSDSNSFWDLDNMDEVSPPPAPVSTSLPDKANVLIRTTTREDKDTVQPQVKPFTRKADDVTFYKFKMPVAIIGGDGQIKPNMVGSYLFPDFFIDPPPVERLQSLLEGAEGARAKTLQWQIENHDKFPVAPELYNVILDTLAPDSGDTGGRWTKAKAALIAKRDELGYTVDKFQGNDRLMLVTVFKEMLLDKEYTLIGRTYTPKDKPGSQFTSQQTVGSFGSDTPEERKRRKVKPISRDTF